MNTTLPPKVEELIKERLQRGTYKTAAEVIEDAFDALTEREKLDALRRDLQEADDQLARGEYTEYDENTLHELVDDIRTRGMERLAEERKKNKQ
jgi:putative addiction module CopG family antidote